MSIAHNFMSILIHRAGFMSIARYEFYDNIGSMYELCSYYDSGFIMNELCSYISYMTFIMIPTSGGCLAPTSSLWSGPSRRILRTRWSPAGRCKGPKGSNEPGTQLSIFWAGQFRRCHYYHCTTHSVWNTIPWGIVSVSQQHWSKSSPDLSKFTTLKPPWKLLSVSRCCLFWRAVIIHFHALLQKERK